MQSINEKSGRGMEKSPGSRAGGQKKEKFKGGRNGTIIILFSQDLFLRCSLIRIYFYELQNKEDEDVLKLSQMLTYEGDVLLKMYVWQGDFDI